MYQLSISIEESGEGEEGREGGRREGGGVKGDIYHGTIFNLV